MKKQTIDSPAATSHFSTSFEEPPLRSTLPFVTVPSDGTFDREDQNYLVADDLAALGAVLIDTKQHLTDIRGRKISSLWKRKGGSSGGKVTLGKCSKTPPLVKTYRDSTFTIWLAADHAREFALTQEQIEALLFHELCHARLEQAENEKTGETTYAPMVAAHDVTMFYAEIEEYGLWTSELRSLKSRVEQIPLAGLDVVAFGAGL